MIARYANSATWRLAEDGEARKFAGLDVDKALQLLHALHSSKRLRDIGPLRRVGLHALKSDRKGQWATTVNAGWRICFRFSAGEAFDVEIVDYD
jgi:proteic killer suppression protein